jgi:N-acyl-D-aspartate/D-glutamate deacylase
VLKAGNHADLLLFDPKTVNRGAKKRVQDLPAGGTRLITPAIGVHGVWVKRRSHRRRARRDAVERAFPAGYCANSCRSPATRDFASP